MDENKDDTKSVETKTTEEMRKEYQTKSEKKRYLQVDTQDENKPSILKKLCTLLYFDN